MRPTSLAIVLSALLAGISPAMADTTDTATDGPATRPMDRALAVGVGTRFTGGSLHPLTRRGPTTISLLATHTVAADTALGDLAVEAAFETGTTAGDTFDTVHSELGWHSVTVGARASLPLLPHLRIHGRAALGWQRTALAMSASGAGSMTGRLVGSGHGMVTHVGGGAEYVPLVGTRAALGLRVDLGYTLATSPSLTLGPENPEDGMLRISETATPVGEIATGGPSLTVSAITWF